MIQNIWSAARGVLAVLAGIVALTVVAFAVELPLRWLTLRLFPKTFPDPAMLDSSALWMLSQTLYTVPATILGGYVAAWLAPRARMAHAVAMAVVQDLLIVVLIFNPPHPVPPWMWGLSLLITPVAIIYGGYLYDSRNAAPQPAAQTGIETQSGE